MTETELISIVVPLYNHARTLIPTLRSIATQTYRPLEVIVVNDGSTDAWQTAWQAGKQILTQSGIHKIKLLEQKNNGAAHARNQGATIATGEYIIFWDADTLAKPRMLETMWNTLQKNVTASYAYSQFYFGWKKIKSSEFDPTLLRDQNYIDVTALLRRKDFMPFDERLRRFQDWDLWLTLLEQGKYGVYIPAVWYRKLVSGRTGISQWLPKFYYRLPWKTKVVRAYESARALIWQKHAIKNNMPKT